jgi:NitT/TauT family transport system substrate-binding protein
MTFGTAERKMEAQMMKRISTLALAIAGIASLSGTAHAQKVWKHGMVEAKSDAGFVFMAEKGGFAAKNGITLESMQFKGDAIALKALIAGEIDSYEGSPGAPMVAFSKGADVRLVGCYWPGLTYAIFTKADVKSVAELKGKTFGISSPGALPDLFARAVLEKRRWDPTRIASAPSWLASFRLRRLPANSRRSQKKWA